MSELTDAIQRIKNLECPAGDLEKRIAGILEEFEVARRDEVTIKRNQDLDSSGTLAYSARISKDEVQSLVILAKTGLDDYVAKVVDAYIF